MDQSPWDKDKILKLTFLNDFDENIKELHVQIILLKRRIENIR